MKSSESIILKYNLTLIPLIFLLLSFFTIYGIKGSYSRYLADDYCYGYRVHENGFIENQITSYFTLTEYSSNRFSSTLFHSIAEKMGGAYFVPYLPTIGMISWFLALLYLLIQIKPRFASKEKITVAITSALVVLFFTLYLAPNLYAVLFWLAAMQSYLTPLVLFTILVGRLLSLNKKTTLKWYNLVEISLLSFLACGFSETTGLWQLTLLFIGLLLAFLYSRQTQFFHQKGIISQILTFLTSIWSAIPSKNRVSLPTEPLKKTIITPRGYRAIVIAFLSSFIALIIMVVCPSNAVRSAGFPRPDFFTFVWKSLFHTEEFVRLSLLGKPIPFLVLFLFAFLLGALAKELVERKTQFYIYSLLATNLISFILILTTMVPSMFAMSIYPGDRALFIPHFTLILTLFINGWLISHLLINILPALPKLRYILFILGIILFSYSLLRITTRVYSEIDTYKLRAQAWDARNQVIVDSKNAGELNITVPAFDSIYLIFGIRENPGHWVNRCATRYYDVESITAVESFNDVPIYSIGK